MRLMGGFEGKLFGSDNWHYTGSFVHAVNSEDDSTFGSSFSMPNLRAGLAGLRRIRVPAHRPTIRCSPERSVRARARASSSTSSAARSRPHRARALSNTADMITYITAQDWQKFEVTSQVADFVVSGELFTLPAGKVGVAIGGQHRRDEWSADYPALQNAGQSDLQAPFFDKNADQTSNAVFAEVSVPLIASDTARHARLHRRACVTRTPAGPGLSTTDPKFGLLYATPSRNAESARHVEHVVPRALAVPAIPAERRVLERGRRRPDAGQRQPVARRDDGGGQREPRNRRHPPTTTSGSRCSRGQPGASTSTTGTSRSRTRSRSRMRSSSRAIRPPCSIRPRSCATPPRASCWSTA